MLSILEITLRYLGKGTTNSIVLPAPYRGLSVMTAVINLTSLEDWKMILGKTPWVEKAMKNGPSACPSASNRAVCDSWLSSFGLNEIAVFIDLEKRKMKRNV